MISPSEKQPIEAFPEGPASESTVRPDGRGVLFWYQALGHALASASCRYRIGQVVEQLLGATAVIAPTLPRGALRGVHTVVCVRPFVERDLRRELESLRARGIRLVADFDDLLFDGDVAEFPTVLQGSVSAATIARRQRIYREGLDLFDAFTVSTEPLRERLSALRPAVPVHVVPNALSPRWVTQGRLVEPPWTPGDPKIIRYLPGSPSHDADFERSLPALRAFLAEHAEVALEVVGPLCFDAAELPKGQVRRREAVPYAMLPRLLASAWVSVAPLVDTDFNRCKSALKLLEAGAFGCPTVATPNPDMLRHGVECFLPVRTKEEWQSALERLLDDDFRMALGARVRRHVDQQAMANRLSSLYHAIYAAPPASREMEAAQ